MVDESGVKNKNLTTRPLQVVRFLARGMSTKQTATVMGISVDTVHKHIRHAQAALGADTRDQLMAMAGVLGLIDMDTKRIIDPTKS